MCRRRQGKDCCKMAEHNISQDKTDLQRLKQILEKERKVEIASSCYQHLEVLEKTCGGKKFMVIGMLPYWSDEVATPRLEEMRERVRKRYPFDQVKETPVQSLLKEELNVGIVSEINRSEVKFLCPVFIAPKKGGKWRKAVDADKRTAVVHTRPYAGAGRGTTGGTPKGLRHLAGYHISLQPHPPQPFLSPVPLFRAPRKILPV